MSALKEPVRYEQIEHTGDIGIKIFGKSVIELFKNAAFGLFDIMIDTSGIGTRIMTNIEIAGDNPEELLVNWLSELNYLFITEDIVFTKFDILRFAENEISANVFGDKYDPRKKQVKTEIKAVTYHEISVKKVKDEWQAQVIFDI